MLGVPSLIAPRSSLAAKPSTLDRTCKVRLVAVSRPSYIRQCKSQNRPKCSSPRMAYAYDGRRAVGF